MQKPLRIVGPPTVYSWKWGGNQDPGINRNNQKKPQEPTTLFILF